MTTAWRPEISESDRTTDFHAKAYPEPPTEPGQWVVMDLWRVREWKDDAVFRTVLVRHLWVPVESEVATFKDGDEHFMLISVSTEIMSAWIESGLPVFRTVRKPE